MLKLYFYNTLENVEISIHEPMFSSQEQAQELLLEIEKDFNSFLGIITQNGQAVQFSKYNRFVWLIEIPHRIKKGSYKIFLTPHKTQKLILDLYNGFNPLKINGLMYEQN